MIRSPIPPQQGAVAIDYIVDGPRTVASVWREESRLLGMYYAEIEASADQEPNFVERERVFDTLSALGERKRVYGDAALCLTVETSNRLPFLGDFDDTGIMRALLDPAGSERRTQENGREGLETPKQASKDRVLDIAPRYAGLVAEIQAQQLGRVYYDIEQPTVAPTVLMGINGLGINTGVMERLGARYSAQEQTANRQLKELAGRAINVNNAEDVAQYLYGDLGLNPPYYTSKGNPAIDKEALQTLADAHDAPGIILGAREAIRIRRAIEGLLERVERASGRVYANINQLGTCTGRFSCSVPNLLALPKEILDGIEAEPDHVLMEADFSQFELLIFANLCQDPVLLETFRRGEDLHRLSAAAIFGVSAEAVTPEQRAQGKQRNFAMLYGSGIDTELYPIAAQWCNDTQTRAAMNQSVRSLHGRRRYLSPQEAYRNTINAIIQATGADILKLALVRLHDRLPSDVRMLLPVHDAVLLEVPRDLVFQIKECVIASMQFQPHGFTVPLKVDVHTGRTWAECKAS